MPTPPASPPNDARKRALRTAQVVTLGLALAGAAGCEQVADGYCSVFTGTRYCCERTGYSTWDSSTNRCVPMAVPGPVVPVPGPIVPPSPTA